MTIAIMVKECVIGGPYKDSHRYSDSMYTGAVLMFSCVGGLVSLLAALSGAALHNNNAQQQITHTQIRTLPTSVENTTLYS